MAAMAQGRLIDYRISYIYQDWLLAYSEKLLETYCFRQFLPNNYNPALEEVPQTLPLAKLGGTSHSREDNRSASGNLGKNHWMGPVNKTWSAAMDTLPISHIPICKINQHHSFSLVSPRIGWTECLGHAKKGLEIIQWIIVFHMFSLDQSIKKTYQ